jgi:hypothetical protein
VTTRKYAFLIRGRDLGKSNRWVVGRDIRSGVGIARTQCLVLQQGGSQRVEAVAVGGQ